MKVLARVSPASRPRLAQKFSIVTRAVVKSLHVNTFLHHLGVLSTVLFGRSITSRIVMARRGFKFTVSEIEHLLETIEDVIPIGNPDWERIWQEHSARYPTKERTSESLKRKFQELARKKIPTGDPNCPPYVRAAKRIFHKIVQATDGSTGGSDVDDDFEETGVERNDDKAGDEDDDMIDSSNNGEDDDDISLPNPAALFPRLGETIGGNNSFPADEEERAQARGGSRSDTESARGGGRVSDTASAQGASRSDTAASASSSSGGAGRAGSRAAPRKNKAAPGRKNSDLSKEAGAGGAQKKSRALTQPFKTPRKSRDNDDSEVNLICVLKENIFVCISREMSHIRVSNLVYPHHPCTHVIQ